jgi:hypothetical protein
MLKTILVLSAFYCLAVLCGCQKEVESVVTPGDSTDTIPTSESYLPLTAGTFWVYNDSATSEQDSAVVLNEELVQNNIHYKKVKLGSDADGTFSYYGILDHNYYIYGQIDTLTGTMLVLNDELNAGGSWTYDMGMIGNVPARGTGTIAEKGISYTVQGTTYQNVIHTRYVISFNLLGTYVDFATYEFYFAKGIGIIKVQSSMADSSGGTETSAQDLVDYTIE